MSLFCYRWGDWPAISRQWKPRGTLQAPRTCDNFYPDWCQVIVTWFHSLPSPCSTREGLHKWDSHRLDSVHWCHEPQVAGRPSHSFDYASAADDAASRVLVANKDAVYAQRALFICIQRQYVAYLDRSSTEFLAQSLVWI